MIINPFAGAIATAARLAEQRNAEYARAQTVHARRKARPAKVAARRATRKSRRANRP